MITGTIVGNLIVTNSNFTNASSHPKPEYLTGETGYAGIMCG